MTESLDSALLKTYLHQLECKLTTFDIITKENKDLQLRLKLEEAKNQIYESIIETNLGIKLCSNETQEVKHDLANIIHECLHKCRESLKNKSPIKQTVKKKIVYKQIKIPIEETVATIPLDSPITSSSPSQNHQTEPELTGDDITDFITKKKAEIDEQIKQLPATRTYSKCIDTLSKLRHSLINYIHLSDYIDLIKNYVDITSDYLKSKAIQPKKIKSIISKGLTNLEFRLIQYEGYIKTPINVDEINIFEKALISTTKHSTIFTPFDRKNFIQSFLNYSSVIFPFEKNVVRILINTHNCWNVIYIPFTKGIKSPYSFYTLEGFNGSRKKWRMDCRLEELANEIINSVKPYLVHVFRTIYRDIFSDNEYRVNYRSKLFITECDCEQLIRNLILMGDVVVLSNELCNIVMKKSTYAYNSEYDTFNISSEDTFQKRRRSNYTISDDDCIALVSQLFDNIEPDTAMSFYKSLRHNI